jgi:hypothetical protein
MPETPGDPRQLPERGRYTELDRMVEEGASLVNRESCGVYCRRFGAGLVVSLFARWTLVSPSERALTFLVGYGGFGLFTIVIGIAVPVVLGRRRRKRQRALQATLQRMPPRERSAAVARLTAGAHERARVFLEPVVEGLERNGDVVPAGVPQADGQEPAPAEHAG